MKFKSLVKQPRDVGCATLRGHIAYLGKPNFVSDLFITIIPEHSRQNLSGPPKLGTGGKRLEGLKVRKLQS